jgi:acyl carrier protein
MNREEFLRQLESALEFAPSTLHDEQVLLDVADWDSLAVVSCMSFVDEKFGVLLSPDQINNSRTVSDLVSLLGSHVR